ncbi:hypothetical protein BJ508DRAFT_124510 [Ascobolus immersus RN42]|uniref:Uncharacterized protein n=1 Tax=Ascobolus immersus RN42 TaxID=1160509 RepID=A0A3N4IG98_ASCIM|nr:hypothetical protein BJ508DRAFT_124510 [Ascobolus immersus RN42]
MGANDNDEVQDAINNAEGWMKECQKLDGLIQTIEVQLETYKQNKRDALIQKERAEAAVIEALRRRNAAVPPSLAIDEHSFDTEMSDVRTVYKRLVEGEHNIFGKDFNGSNKRARVNGGTLDAHLSTGEGNLSDVSMSGRTPHSPLSPVSPITASFSQQSTSTMTTASQAQTPVGRGRGMPPKTPAQRSFEEAKRERDESLGNKRRARAEDFDEDWTPNRKPASSRGTSKASTTTRSEQAERTENITYVQSPAKKPWEKDFQPILGKRSRDSDAQPATDDEDPNKRARSVSSFASGEHGYDSDAPPPAPTSAEWLASQGPPPHSNLPSGKPSFFSRRFISKHLGGNEMRDISNVSAAKQATQVHPVPGYFGKRTPSPEIL